MESRTETRTGRYERDEQVPMYHFEHMTAYLVAAVAIAFGAIGLLRAFGMIGGEGAVFEGSLMTGEKWDALLWLVPALTLAMLSYALHQSDHHLMRDPESLDDAHKGMWTGEHFLAWLTALGSIALIAIGMLVGFNVFTDEGRYSQADGLMWTLPGLGLSVLTNTLHAVRHHQLATDQDYIIATVEERVRSRGEGRTVTTEAERNPNR